MSARKKKPATARRAAKPVAKVIRKAVGAKSSRGASPAASRAARTARAAKLSPSHSHHSHSSASPPAPKKTADMSRTKAKNTCPSANSDSSSAE